MDAAAVIPVALTYLSSREHSRSSWWSWRHFEHCCSSWIRRIFPGTADNSRCPSRRARCWSPERDSACLECFSWGSRGLPPSALRCWLGAAAVGTPTGTEWATETLETQPLPFHHLRWNRFRLRRPPLVRTTAFPLLGSSPVRHYTVSRHLCPSRPHPPITISPPAEASSPRTWKESTS